MTPRRPPARSTLLARPAPHADRRAFLAAIAAGGAALPFACNGTTGGGKFAFPARAGGAERDATAGPFRFENELGWQIELTRADLTFGPVYFNTVAPLRTASFGLPFVKSAFAHDSHLSEGTIVGEVLGQLTIDLLSPELVDFPAPGTLTRDQILSLEICYYPAPNAPPDAPGSDVAALGVAGRATRGTEIVAFRGDLVLDSTWQPTGQPGSNNYEPLRSLREVRGVPAQFTPDEGGSFELRVDAGRLFRGASFEALAQNPLDADGVTRVLVQAKGTSSSTDPIMRALYNNLRASAGGTYVARWRDG